jgi:glycosyltransferase involved in cell wall biosynthesis
MKPEDPENAARVGRRFVFIAWSRSGRPQDFATALGGEARVFFDLGLVSKWLVPLRYAISSLRTLAYLARARPRAVIVSSPPVFPGAIAYAYSALFRRPLVLDAHPASFGLKGDGLTRSLMPLQRFLARRARTNLVTVPALADLVTSWGGNAMIVHEPPSRRNPTRKTSLSLRPSVLFVTIFEPDEPVAIMLEAARLLDSGVDVAVTGDLRKRPPDLGSFYSPNVTFVGYLTASEYAVAFDRADVIVSLTDRAEAVSRVGCEASYSLRPLVISGTAAARSSFPYATHVENTASDIAAGIRSVLSDYPMSVARADRAYENQIASWKSQAAMLMSVLEPSRRITTRDPRESQSRHVY